MAMTDFEFFGGLLLMAVFYRIDRRALLATGETHWHSLKALIGFIAVAGLIRFVG
jgi:hypothetical protein